MKLLVTMDWSGRPVKVGDLEVFRTRGTETYQFIYAREWIDKGFQIDPTLALIPDFVHHSQNLPGVFQDISPDRWGRLIQTRVHNENVSAFDLLLGVSDHMRMGAIRLSDANQPDVFLADNTNIPKLVNIRALEEACRRVEKGLETQEDLRQLVGPGSSLGGARPKAAVYDNNQLYIAKFQSNQDTERVGAWESTLLDLAQKAGLSVASHLLLNKHGERPILLLERFDRSPVGRIPFVSAMTLTGRSDGESASYGELSSAILSLSAQAKRDAFELWQRMAFNAMTGNTDDHLRNHAFLRDRQGWRLSPAYDLNPNNTPYDRRIHALAFITDEKTPSLDLCVEMAKPFFNLDKTQVAQGLKAIGNALKQWRQTARQNGLADSEIKRMARAFEHQDSERLLSGWIGPAPKPKPPGRRR